MKMRAAAVMLVTVTAWAGTASAQMDAVYRMERNAAGEIVHTRVEEGLSFPALGFRAYDNWRTSTQGGQVGLRGRYRMGGDEVGDDLFLTTTGPALMNDLAYSIYNFSETQSMQSVVLTLRIYDAIGGILFEFSDEKDVVIPPRSGAAFFSNSNVYAGFNVFLPQQVFMSMQFSNASGVDLADMGSTLVGPNNNGYSTQFARNFTSGETLNFDGTDQTNMRFFVDTATVPSPATLGVAICVGLVSARKRRVFQER